MGQHDFDEPTVRALPEELEGELAMAALGASRDAFVAVDEAGRVLAWNPAAEALLGWSAEEVAGSPLPWGGEEGLPRPGSDLASAQVLPVVIVRPHRDGTPRTIVVERQLSVSLGSGKVHGWFFREAEQGEAALSQRNVLSQELAEAVRVDEVREHVGRAATGLLGADRAVVLAPCPAGEHLHGHVAIGAHQEHAERLVLRLREPGPAQRSALDRSLETGTLAFATHEPQPTLFVPMGPDHAGWVLALVYPGGVPASGDLPQLARAVAGEGWAALRRVELVRELEEKVEILEATAAVSSSAGLDLCELLERVCRHAAVALSCERAAVYLRPGGAPADAAGRDLELAHAYAADLEAVPEDAEDPLVGRAAAAEFLRRREPFVVQDAATCPFLDGLWHPDQGAVSVFGLPLRVGERDLGVLVVAHTVAHPRGFTNLCQQVGTSIAQQAALAIENARLFANERETVRRLSELDRLKADYVAGISHDLRTPLTGLLGFVKTLRRTDQAATAEERHEYLEIMDRQANRLAGMISDLLVSAQLEAGALTLDAALIDIDDLVGEAVSMLDPDRRDRVHVTPGARVEVRGDRSQLLRVVGNLVDNALRYSPEGAQVTVRVARDEQERQAVLAVSDRGPGIPDDDLPGVFQRYRQGGGGRNGSVGLGLYITHGIVTGHDGRIDVETGPEGTTFTVRLPLAEPPS